MPYITAEKDSTNLLGHLDALGNEKNSFDNTLFVEIKDVPKGFDARDVDYYLEKNGFIRRTGEADGVTMDDKEMAIGYPAGSDTKKIIELLEKLFDSNLEELRKEYGRK